MEDNSVPNQPGKTIEEVRNEIMVNDYQNIQLRIAKANEELEELLFNCDEETEQYIINRQLREKHLSSLEDEIKQKQCNLIKLEDERQLIQEKSKEEKMVLLVQADGQRTRLGALKDQVPLLENKIKESQANLKNLESILLENKNKVLSTKNELDCLRNEKNELLAETKRLKEEIKKELIELDRWKEKSEDFSLRLKEVEKQEKETKNIFNEVAVMHVRLKPKYLKTFKKFNNLD